MSIFGFYFVSGLLREAGWPKRQGILRRNAIDTTILDSAVCQMIDWAAAIGAGRPKLGLQVLAEMYRDTDWSSDNRPSIRMFIDGMKSKNCEWAEGAAIAPSDVVSPTKFTQLGRTIDASKMTDPQMRMALEHFCLEGLLWGFANHESFANWYSGYFEGKNESRALARASGIDLEELSDLPDFFDECERILRNYERDIGELPEIPDRLSAEARELGREI